MLSRPPSLVPVADLVSFEAEIAEHFNRGDIRAPIHLSGGNEESLISIFRHSIRPGDWFACSWRSHYHCLLKGVPRHELKAAILAGRSITLCFPEHRVISSAIVGGVLPIALGLAWSIRRHDGLEKVWAFCGDMTAMSGMFMECMRYAAGHRLPIQFVIESNGKSVCTDTFATWGIRSPHESLPLMSQTYHYDLPWPHSGAGKRVEF